MPRIAMLFNPRSKMRPYLSNPPTLPLPPPPSPQTKERDDERARAGGSEAEAAELKEELGAARSDAAALRKELHALSKQRKADLDRTRREAADALAASRASWERLHEDKIEQVEAEMRDALEEELGTLRDS